MGKKVNIIGKRFGRLVVVEQAERKSSNGTLYWKCICDCGKSKEIRGTNLTSGATTSCGCYNKEIISKDNPKYKRKLYYIYRGMLDRCNNKNNKHYSNYGGRGIGVCDEWNIYENFEKWALENGYAKGLWIDRIDNNSDYNPTNCRFCTPKEQQNNKRTNVIISIGGVEHTIQQWSDISGIKRATIERRYKLGWNPEDLLKPIDVSKSHGDAIRRIYNNSNGGMIWVKEKN